MKNLKFKWLLLSIILSVAGISHVWAYDGFTYDNNTFNNPYLYFYNSQGWNKAAVIFGRKYDKDNYTKVANMALVANTSQLYYVYVNDYWNTSYNEIAVMEVEKSGDSWGDAAQDIETRWNAVSHKTAIKWNYGFTDDYGTYYITSSGSDNIDISYKSNGYSDIPKCTTTLEVQTRNSNGLYTAINSDAPATLTIGGTYLSSMSSNQINSTTAYDANSWPTASTFNSVISGLAKVKYASMDDKYQFDGWYVSDSQEGTGTEYTFYQTTNTTVVAKFTRIKYTVNFDQQSGSDGSSSVTATYNSAMPSATMPTRSNYTFDGYYSGTSGTGTKYYNADGSSAKTCDLTGDITLYAKWTQTVTLDANTSHGGSAGDGSATATWNGGALTDISHPRGATGYTCTGYFTAETGGTKVLNADGTYAGENITDYITSNKWSRTSSTTLYAQWDNHYTVTFDQGTPTIQGTDNTIATYDSEMPAVTVPSKTGYIFGGYFADLEDEEHTKYYNANGTSANDWDIAENTTLHAKWTGISYQVAFDANEGTGSMTNQALTYGPDIDATNVNLSRNNNNITREGYYFLGWNTRPDGSGTKFYDQKPVRNLTTVDGGIVTLYAQWAKTHTLYFLNIKTDGWNQGSGIQSNATRYAYSIISYDNHEMYPLGTWTDNGPQGSVMTVSSSITLTNVHNTAEWCWSIAGVPEGASIRFSDNTSSNKTGDLTGWTAEKTYYCKGNDSWYALDGDNEISKMTLESVHIGEGHFGSGVWKYYGIDKHGDGEEDQYAIIWLEKDKTYQYKYSNWYNGASESGQSGTSNIIDGEKTTADFGGFWTLDGRNNVGVRTNAHATGEYKFVFKSGASPQTKVYVPRGVNLTSTSPTSAPAGESVTVSFTADAWEDPKTGSDMNNPTYYFEFSKDNRNWSTVATYSATSAMQANTSYTFPAESGYFRVKLVNDHGLASYSGSTAFTAYSTKSFYVFNPYNNSSDKWETLHLYTWDSNNDNTTYNGSFPGNDASSCINGNAIVSKGGDWFYITIDERANCFMLVGDETYNAHQTVTCYVNNYVADGKYMIYTESNQNKFVEYQAKGASDYRLKYTGRGGVERYSPIYNTTLDGASVTTSMWMNAHDATAAIAIQQGDGENRWVDKVTYTGSSLTNLLPSTKQDTGYVFQMQLNFYTEAPASSDISNVAEYTGSYYVRTDGLDGGWNVYQKADHMMHYSEASLHGTPRYDHYLCKWIGSSGTNVKFTVANDYNPELVASLEGDAGSTDPLYNRQTLPEAANVRFSWNSQTDTLTRAYLSGASSASSRFLVMVETTSPTGRIYDKNGCALITGAGNCKVDGLNEHELLFEDNGNWVYQLNLKANPGAKAKVMAKYNNQEPEFIPSTTLIGGDDLVNKYSFRIVYDFKTNILTNAWVADNTEIVKDIDLKSNVMIVRVGQGDAVQLTFADGKKLTSVEKVYGVMQFNRSTINDESISRYKRDLYWISFPFDVKLKDAFGMGTYGTHWIIEYYDGKGRATNGFWADSPSNWKFVTPAMRETGGDDGTGYVLKANEGYILALDLDELGSTSPVWENDVNETFLYFPSKDDVGNIQNTTAVVDLGTPADYQCKINRATGTEGDRRIKDSYWHCIGVPSYANVLDDNVTDSVSRTVVWNASSLPFLYQWNGYSTGENTLEVVSTSSSDFTFKPMYSYLVQYNLRYMHWSAVTNNASVAARITEMPDKEYALTLNYGDTEQDKAMLRLTDNDGVSNRFEFNYDLSKEYNAGRGNIWTVTADTVEVAGNSMPKPVQTTVVPVGVKVVANGEYTLSMPEGTNGEDVYLIDNAYGTRTNLGLMPYTVTLTAGTYEGRFALEFGPIQDAPTSLENDGLSRSDELNDANDDVRKVFVGGRLYIIRDGKVYDAAGQRVE